MFSLKNANLHYSKSQILYNISFEAKVGEITTVIGPNGVGKTSLLRLLSGTHPLSSGTYYEFGKDISNFNSHELALKGVAYVPQGREIFPLLTVKENLEIGFICLKKNDQFIPDFIYEMFPVLKHMLKRRGGDLSGGQQQQLAIARALITKPKLLLLDEPTEGIQPSIIKQIGRVIEALKKRKNIAIVIIEQYFDFAYKLSDQIYVMKQGKFVISGKKQDLDKEKIKKAVSI